MFIHRQFIDYQNFDYCSFMLTAYLQFTHLRSVLNGNTYYGNQHANRPINVFFSTKLFFLCKDNISKMARSVTGVPCYGLLDMFLRLVFNDIFYLTKMSTELK